jgi:hypothetical protein
VLRGLAFDPAARVLEARQFGDDLAQALLGGGEPTRTAVTLRASVPPEPGATVPRPQAASRWRGWLVAGVVTVALGVMLGLVYLARSRRSPEAQPALQQETTPGPGRLAEERTLTYSVTLRRGQTTRQVVDDAVVVPKDRVQLAFMSAQHGYLYIFNAGPQETAGLRNVNVLFPSVTSNNGSAELQGRQTVTIPEAGDGFVVDEEKGVEKLWIVWSRAAQPGLDAMGRRWANAKHGGEIKDAQDVEALDTFLREHRSPRPDAAVDDDATTLSARADVFVKLVELKHQ